MVMMKSWKFYCFSRVFFSAEQAAHILSAFPRPKDRLKCVKILEPKLVSMTCQQGKNILAAVSLEEDRLEALQYIKRVLTDANTQEGVDNIISTFTYHDHKVVAIQILQTIVSKKGVKLAAGGHQGYAPLGGLYTSAQPNNNHIYGPSIEQVQHLPNHHIRLNQTETIGFGPFTSSIYNSNLADPKSSSSYGNYNQYITPNQYLNPNKI